MHHRDYAVGKFVDSIIVHITILAAIAIGTYNYTISVGGGLISFQHTTASYFRRSSIVRQSNSRPDHSSGTIVIYLRFSRCSFSVFLYDSLCVLKPALNRYACIFKFAPTAVVGSACVFSCLITTTTRKPTWL